MGITNLLTLAIAKWIEGHKNQIGCENELELGEWISCDDLFKHYSAMPVQINENQNQGGAALTRL